MGSAPEQRECAGYDGEGVGWEGAGTCISPPEWYMWYVKYVDEVIGTAIVPATYSIYNHLVSDNGSTAACEDRAGLDHEV